MPTVYYAYYLPASGSVQAIREQEHCLGRKLLAAGLSRLYGLEFSCEDLSDPESVILGYRNSKPYLTGYPDIHFNISHCSGLVVCAFHDKPIGVDVELPGYFADILLKRALSETERKFFQRFSGDEKQRQECFFRFWTLKEAYVKCYGTGVDTDLKAVSFSFPQSAPDDPFVLPGEGIGSHEIRQISCSDPDVLCFQKKTSHGQIISICWKFNPSEAVPEPFSISFLALPDHSI